MTYPFQKIMIFGRPGSGKSTFAVQLAQGLGIPVYHIDKIFFEQAWIKRERSEFLALKQEWIDKECWIIDGNAISVLESRFSKADVALYFNFPWYICLYRIVKRLWSRDKRIDDRAPNSPERITWDLIKYMLNFRAKYNTSIENLAQKFPKVMFREIRNAQDLMAVRQEFK
jgi:adenylate kinase family enzyme